MSFCHHQPLHRFVQELDDNQIERVNLRCWKSPRTTASKFKWAEESKRLCYDRRLIALRFPAHIREWQTFQPFYSSYAINKFLCKLFNISKQEFCILRTLSYADPKKYRHYLHSIYVHPIYDDQNDETFEALLVTHLPDSLCRSVSSPHNYPTLIPTLVDNCFHTPYIFTDVIFVQFYQQPEPEQMKDYIIYSQVTIYSSPNWSIQFHLSMENAILVSKSKTMWLYAVPWNANVTCKEEVVDLCAKNIQWCSDRCEGFTVSTETRSPNLLHINNSKDRIGFCQGFTEGFTEDFCGLYEEFNDFDEPRIMLFGGYANIEQSTFNFSTDLDLYTFFNPTD